MIVEFLNFLIFLTRNSRSERDEIFLLVAAVYMRNEHMKRTMPEVAKALGNIMTIRGRTRLYTIYHSSMFINDNLRFFHLFSVV